MAATCRCCIAIKQHFIAPHRAVASVRSEVSRDRGDGNTHSMIHLSEIYISLSAVQSAYRTGLRLASL